LVQWWAACWGHGWGLSAQRWAAMMAQKKAIGRVNERKCDDYGNAVEEEESKNKKRQID
jgi:hypothetical protein